MVGKPLPSLSLRVPFCSSKRLGRMSCAPAQTQQLKAAVPRLYFLKVSTAQWTSEAFQPHCSSPAFNGATSGVYLLRSLFCTVLHSWVPINQLVLQTSSQNCPESYPEKAVLFPCVLWFQKEWMSPVHFRTNSRSPWNPVAARVLWGGRDPRSCVLPVDTEDGWAGESPNPHPTEQRLDWNDPRNFLQLLDPKFSLEWTNSEGIVQKLTSLQREEEDWGTFQNSLCLLVLPKAANSTESRTTPVVPDSCSDLQGISGVEQLRLFGQQMVPEHLSGGMLHAHGLAHLISFHPHHPLPVRYLLHGLYFTDKELCLREVY